MRNKNRPHLHNVFYLLTRMHLHELIVPYKNPVTGAGLGGGREQGRQDQYSPNSWCARYQGGHSVDASDEKRMGLGIVKRLAQDTKAGWKAPTPDSLSRFLSTPPCHIVIFVSPKPMFLDGHLPMPLSVPATWMHLSTHMLCSFLPLCPLGAQRDGFWWWWGRVSPQISHQNHPK